MSNFKLVINLIVVLLISVLIIFSLYNKLVANEDFVNLYTAIATLIADNLGGSFKDIVKEYFLYVIYFLELLMLFKLLSPIINRNKIRKKHFISGVFVAIFMLAIILLYIIAPMEISIKEDGAILFLQSILGFILAIILIILNKKPKKDINNLRFKINH